MFHIQRGIFGENTAMFYLAEVLLALGFLHDHQIIYRDLKLENLLLGTDGHLKMADFGLCKGNMGRNSLTGTFCGTPEFMAPEILLDEKYTIAVDWWSFGVLAYEMIVGQPPFKGNDEDEIFRSVLSDTPHYPVSLSLSAANLIRRLLIRTACDRLGSGPDGHREIAAATRSSSPWTSRRCCRRR